MMAAFVVTLFMNCKKEAAPKVPSAQPNFKTYEGIILVNDNSTVLTNDSNLLFICKLNEGLSVIKTDLDGNQIWREDFAVGSFGHPASIIETDANEIFVCSSSNANYNIRKTDVSLVKMNSAGNIQWTKTYGGIDSDYGRNILATSDGNILISGQSESFGAGSFRDIYMLKIKPNGDTLWTKNYPDLDEEIPYHLLETTDGGFLITGMNRYLGVQPGFYMMKVASDGKLEWSKFLWSGLEKMGYATVELDNGDLITVGNSGLVKSGQLLVVKMDDKGNVIWEKEFGEHDVYEVGSSIKKNYDNTFTITGGSGSFSNGNQYDILVLKIDDQGNEIWMKKFGRSPTSWGFNLIKGSKNENIITGNYNAKVFMTKLDENGIFQ